MRSPCSRRALPQWHPRPSRAQATAQHPCFVRARSAAGQRDERDTILDIAPKQKTGVPSPSVNMLSKVWTLPLRSSCVRARGGPVFATHFPLCSDLAVTALHCGAARAESAARRGGLRLGPAVLTRTPPVLRPAACRSCAICTTRARCRARR